MIDPGRRVLLFSSIGHALMHMMTAFYAVIVLTLAISWKLPPEDLLRLYAPATILLGVVSLPAGWLSDRFGAPAMMVVMFVGLGLSSIACGLVPTGDTLMLSLALCGIGTFGAFYHSVGIGWVIRTAKEQGHAMGVNGLWGSAGLALYGIVPGVLITIASWRAAFIVPGIVCIAVGVVLFWQMRQGKGGFMPASLEDQALVWQWSFWGMTEVEKPLLTILIDMFMTPPDKRKPDAVADAQKMLPKPFGVLNGALQGRDYLLGSTFTVADLNLASVMSWAKPIKFDFGPYPNAGAWLDRCLARPAYKAARGGK